MSAFVAAILLAAAVVAGLGVQARRARRRALRLPEVADPGRGITAGVGSPLRLILLGDSTVAGVGAPSHDAALAGSTARALAHITGRPVHWRAVGRSGFAAREVAELLVPSVSGAADVAIVVVGVNDTTRLHLPGRFARDLERLVCALRTRIGDLPVVIAGVPPMGRFLALPQPLRATLGLWAGMLDRAARRVARRLPRVVHQRTLIRSTADFSPDGYHPGQVGYAAWGAALAATVAQQLA